MNNPFSDYLSKHPGAIKPRKENFKKKNEEFFVEDSNDEVKLEDENIISEPSEVEVKEKKESKEHKKQARTESDISDNILTNVVLMLNQILQELNVLNQKIDSQISSLEETSKPITPQPAKRKIILNRDENGKIIGADVIEVDTEDEE